MQRGRCLTLLGRPLELAGKAVHVGNALGVLHPTPQMGLAERVVHTLTAADRSEEGQLSVCACVGGPV